MAKYLDWYSVELDGYLKGRLSDVKRFEAIKEIQNHFAEHIEELKDKGMGEVEAEKAALATFGSPRDAAMQLLNQGPRSRFGGVLSTIAAVLVVLSIGTMTGYFHLAGVQSFGTLIGFGGPYGLWNTSMGILSAVGILSLISAFLSRKVYFGKLLLAWSISLVLSFAFLVLGPEKHFADVPPEKYAAMHDLWVKANDSTVKLAALETKILKATGRGQGYYYYSDGEEDKFDKTAAANAIQTYAPQMLNIEPEYCKLVGDKTKGYLAPRRTNAGSQIYYYRYRGMNVGASSGGSEDTPKTGPNFPYAQVNLRYVDTPSEAISAWQNYSNYSSEFRSSASQQVSFLQDADRITKMNRLQLALMTEAPLAGGTLLNLLFLSGVCWVVSKIPSFALRSTFRRVVA